MTMAQDATAVYRVHFNDFSGKGNTEGGAGQVVPHNGLQMAIAKPSTWMKHKLAFDRDPVRTRGPGTFSRRSRRDFRAIEGHIVSASLGLENAAYSTGRQIKI